jgi:RND family efflux transporter MFP subunit
MKKLVLLITTAMVSAAIAGSNYKIGEAKAMNGGGTKEFVGVLYSPTETMVSTRMMGYIKRIAVEEGDRIKKGQLLFEVDPADIDAGKRMADAGAVQAKLAYDDAKRDYDRFKTLYEKGAVPLRDMEKMKLNMQMREQSFQMAKEGQNQAGEQYKYTTIRSTVNGVVVRKMANVSEMAIPGHPVLIVSGSDNLRINVTLPEQDAGKIKPGTSATVSIPSTDKKSEATIISVTPAADMATHSFSVKASIKDQSGLIPGMYAKLLVASSDKCSGVVVSPSMLTSRGGIKGIFAVESGKAKFYQVKVVRSLNDQIQVEGIKVGTKVIEYPKADLVDGQAIK